MDAGTIRLAFTVITPPLKIFHSSIRLFNWTYWNVSKTDYQQHVGVIIVLKLSQLKKKIKLINVWS